MSRGDVTAGQRYAVAGWFAVAAAAFSATAAGADAASTTDATVPVKLQSANAAKFEAFVRQVGLDMSSVPAELRREWANAPRVGIDDCAIPGTHAGHGHGHGHGPDGAEQAFNDSGAAEHRPKR